MHGAPNHPTECPAECALCGYRHGAEPKFRQQYKIGAECLAAVAHPDAQTTSKTVDGYAYFEGTHAVPTNAREGSASGEGNNCLLHTLLQLTKGESRTDTWAADVKRCAEVRAQLVANRECSPTSLLTLHDWWAPILHLYGEDPAAYTIYCFTEGDAGEKHGTGNNVLYMRNQGFNHFVPIWTNVPAGPRIRTRAGSQKRPAVRLQENQPKRTRRTVDIDPPQATNDCNLWNIATAHYRQGMSKPSLEELKTNVVRCSARVDRVRRNVMSRIWPHEQDPYPLKPTPPAPGHPDEDSSRWTQR